MTLKDWAERQRRTTIVDVVPLDQSGRRKRGPKTKRTPETEALLYDALCKGVPIKVACQYAGISEDAYYDWAKADPEFDERMTRSRGASVVRSFDIIAQAAPNDWRAAEAALRLSRPKEFGRNAEPDVEANTTNILVTSPEYAKVCRVVLDVLLPYPAIRAEMAAALKALT